MAHINGKNIPFVYHAVPTASNVKVVTGIAAPTAGATTYNKLNLGFKPDIVIWSLYDAPTDAEATDTSYTIKDTITGLTYNITWAEELGTTYTKKPINITSQGFVAYAGSANGATFKEGNTYQWIAIKSEG